MLKEIFVRVFMNKGEKCPKCGSTNTDQQNGIWHCYECGKEW